MDAVVRVNPAINAAARRILFMGHLFRVSPLAVKPMALVGFRISLTSFPVIRKSQAEASHSVEQSRSLFPFQMGFYHP